MARPETATTTNPASAVVPSSTRVIIVALAANAAVALAKFGAFAITGSAAMLAEALHTTADSGNQALMLLGERRSRRSATPSHPFGFGRERYFWGFVVATVLFTLGSLMSLAEGEEKLRHPHPVEMPVIAVAILLIAGLLESLSLRTAIRRARPHRERGGWLVFIRQTKSSELPVVLLEDSGALIGLVFALGGIIATMATGNPRFDAIGSIAIGLLLGAIALFLGSEMRSLLVGEAASDRRQAEIRAALSLVAGIEDVSRLETLQIGPEDILVLADVEVRGTLTLSAAQDVAMAAEQRLHHDIPTATRIFIRPVSRPGAHSAESAPN